MSINQAVILVGGRGTRLGDLTRTTPKPLLDVGGRPFVEYVIQHLSRFAITDVVLLAGYQGEKFRTHYDCRKMFGIRVSVAVEPEPLGTAGALAFIKDRLDPLFAIVNGDTFFDADIAPLLASSKRRGNSILLRQCDDASRYGHVALAGDGRVIAFREKEPSASGTKSTLINAGCYVFDRGLVLDRIRDLPCSLETSVLPQLAAEGRLSGVTASGYFVDVGVPDSLEVARQELPRVRKRPAAFFDRDGVINIDHGYTHRTDDLELVQGATESLRLLNEAGYYTIVISNQGGIAHGYYSELQAEAFNLALRRHLMKLGARLDAIYFCPHHPEGVIPELAQVCGCRKPAPGLLHQAVREWPICQDQSFMIGDMPTDLEAARAFGVRSYRYEGGSLLSMVERALASNSANTTCTAAPVNDHR